MNQNSPDSPRQEGREPLLEVRDLAIRFRLPGGGELRAVDGLDLTVGRGEIVGLVGESGCGKSVSGLALARLLSCPPARIARGGISFAGRDVLAMGKKELRELRGGKIAYVFQEPQASFNPVMTVGSQIAEAVRLHTDTPSSAIRAKVIDALAEVGITSPGLRYGAYPHQMSGGMLQRAMIAMAVAARPALVVADEPTTALDVTVQARILELFRDISRKTGVAVLLISHDLGVVNEIADRVLVMYCGRVVESAPCAKLFAAPSHPYTRGLLASIPRPGFEGRRLTSIPGRVNPVVGEVSACRFADRCSLAVPECRQGEPGMFSVSEGHLSRCLLAGRAAAGSAAASAAGGGGAA